MKEVVDLSFSVFKDDEKRLKKAALEIYRAKLFVPGWSLEDTLREIASYGDIFQSILVIGYDGNKPIAVGCLDRTFGEIDVFVLDEYRRMGIGRMIIQQVAQDFDLSMIRCNKGVEGSLEFYASCGVVEANYVGEVS